jgi:hypothetical protein
MFVFVKLAVDSEFGMGNTQGVELEVDIEPEANIHTSNNSPALTN